MSRSFRAAHLAYIVRPTPLHGVLGPLLERLSERHWERTGEGPAPASLKQRVVREYAHRHGFRTFVETGTFFGDMIEAIHRDFDRVHSVELDEKLHRRAVRRFAGTGNVALHQGDSGKVLPGLVDTLREPTLFWLDAHWSRGVTAKGDLDTPVSLELETVIRHPIEGHVALIDDARLFGAAKDYPSIDQVRSAVAAMRPDWDVRVADDIIHVGARDMLLVRLDEAPSAV